jgi:hypothetical protein
MKQNLLLGPNFASVTAVTSRSPTPKSDFYQEKLIQVFQENFFRMASKSKLSSKRL